MPDMRSPPQGWSAHPNLRLRPRAPAAGRGRLQVQIRRALACNEIVSSSQVYDWCYARRRRLNQRKIHSVWRILRVIADPIGRAPTIGRPWLWRLKDEHRK
jgi:hypothetical protein